MNGSEAARLPTFCFFVGGCLIRMDDPRVKQALTSYLLRYLPAVLQLRETIRPTFVGQDKEKGREPGGFRPLVSLVVRFLILHDVSRVTCPGVTARVSGS